MPSPSTYPTSKQLLLPFLDLMNQGATSAAAIYDKLADEFNLTPLLKEKTVLSNISYWRRKCRWVMQDLKQKGFILQHERNHWNLTEEGKTFLQNAKPGVVITVFTTPKGESIWAECQHALTNIKDDSVQLCFTSPPYDLITPKEYGNLSGKYYIDWLADICCQIKRTLKPDGSLVLNLGNTYLPGIPEQSLYQERLMIKLCDEMGFSLAQRLFWYKTTALPGPTKWASKDRVRVKDSLETLWWLGKSPNVYANNAEVLKEYADSHKRLMAKANQKGIDKSIRTRKPGGLTVSEGIYSNNGGAIPDNIILPDLEISPDNIIVFPNNYSWDANYAKECEKYNLLPHPARFPKKLPEFFIKFLTKPGDTILDPFSGSNITGQVAESLNRQWIAIEKSFHYIKTSIFRFNQVSINPIFR